MYESLCSNDDWRPFDGYLPPFPLYSINHCMTGPVVTDCLVGCSIFAWKNPASPTCVAFLPVCLLTPLHFPFLLGEPAVRFAQTIAVRNISLVRHVLYLWGDMEIMHSPVGPTGYSTLALLLQCNRRWTGDLVFSPC
jgi:hypothetical protein